MNRQHIYVVDDEESVRDALVWLLESVQLSVSAHSDADDFLRCFTSGLSACLLLDVRMPGMSGLELQRTLKLKDIDIPIIFLTGHCDVDMAVRTMKLGAFDFIQKPFNNQQLLDVIYAGLKRSDQIGWLQRQNSDKQKKLSTLTVREHEVFLHAVDGFTNKMIAKSFDISVKTVEAHRASIMRKLNARSLAELIDLSREARPKTAIF